jgi:hypothetical protein
MGGPYVAQWPLWRCLVPARPNNVGMFATASARGAAVAGMAAQG